MEHSNTLRTLHLNGYNLHTYCHRCEHWRVIDLGELVSHGHGSLQPPEHWVCSSCGELGLVRVRAPASDQRAA
jgi:hypothetical protein